MSDFLKNIKKGTEGPQVKNPLKAAQVAMQAELPKRFYKQCFVEERKGGFQVLLDGKSIKTPGKNTLNLPTIEAAQLVAAEWQAQETVIDPRTMHATRIVNTAIDGVSKNLKNVLDDIIKYSETDLLCYRADGPEGLIEMQASHWDPVLDWYSRELGANFVLVEGVMFSQQPQEAIDTFKLTVETFRHPITVACLHTLTSMTGSALLAMALAKSRLNAHEAWACAHVDERWNESLWGEDFEATNARAKKFEEFLACSHLFDAVGYATWGKG